MACTFDFEAKHPLHAIGHFNLSESLSRLVVDVPNYIYDTSQTEGSRLGPWQYVSVTAVEGAFFTQVFPLPKGNASAPWPIDATSINEVHCSPQVCYALDINAGRIVSFNPFSGATTTLIRYGTEYAGCLEDASALDTKNLVLYLTLIDQSMNNVLVAADLEKRTITPLNVHFAANNTGPYCFDSVSSRLISLGSPLGAIVAWTPTTGRVDIIREQGYGGIAGERCFDCQNNVAVLAYIDDFASTSPMRLLGLDLVTGSVFHNSTCIDIHGLYLSN